MFCTKHELNEYLVHQAKLDELIATTQKIDLNQNDYIQRRILALLVELSELANEIRFFKYWKSVPPVDKNKALEEYIDCWHFILSLMNAFAFDINELYSPETEAMNKKARQNIDNDALTHDFLKLSEFTVELTKTQKIKPDFVWLFSDLSSKLKFELTAIKNAYYNKNKINFYRQETAY